MRVRKTAVRPLNVKLPAGIKSVLPDLAEADYLQTATAWVTRAVSQYVGLPVELFSMPEAPAERGWVPRGEGAEILFYECPERLARRLGEVIGERTHAALALHVAHAIVYAVNRATRPMATAV